AIVVFAVFFALSRLKVPAPSHSGVIGQVTNVPSRTLSAVGAGQSYPDAIARTKGEHPLVSNARPEVLYIGAAFCPYCAADQWSIIVALSRFGTFTGPTSSRSAPSPEKYPRTATLTFEKAGYSSSYLTFVSVESENVNRQPLQHENPQERRLWRKYTEQAWP